MKIRILETISGAKEARGLTVIIDVFRAFSLEPYLISRGAEYILAVGREETARRLKREHPEAVLIGERGGVKLPGFDYGNSPSQTEGAALEGKMVIHTTSAGTQGIVNAAGASQIITGSLVNAGAVAEYIKKESPEEVSLVAMGLSGKVSAPEDVLCAGYIKALLTGEAFDMDAGIAALRKTESAEKFFREENQKVFPERDYHLCTRTDCFGFVLGVTKVEEDVFKVERQ